uniref:Transducin beta-like protein 3 n=1 Tax=Noccaea caerulescens TaxID=107243 RepID=A0A1J3DCT9_NOCCA
MVSHSLKKNYRCSRSLKQFYSGGPFVVSSDGSFIVCACGDAINIVDSSDSSVKSTIEGESDTLTALALSPDNKFLFSAGHSRQIRVWDLETLKCIRSWKGEGPVMGMACDASGGLLATGGADSKVHVWDVDGGFCTHFFKGHKGVVRSVLFHPDATKNILFSASDDETVRVWDLLAKGTEKKCFAILNKHFSAVTSIAVSEDGWTLLSAGRDKVVNVWDLHDYSCKTTVATYEVLEAVITVRSGTPFASFVASLDKKNKKKKTASQDSTHFITFGERGVVRIWKSEGSVCLYEQKSSDITVSSEDQESKRGFTAATMLPCDRGLLCVTADQQFFIYSVVENVEESELVLSKRLVGYNEEIADMKFLGYEEQFLAVATNLEEVRVYDVATMSCSYVLAGHKEVVLSLDTCVSSSGNVLVVTGSKDKTVRLWNATSKSCIGVGTGHNGDILAVAFAKKSKSFFVSGSGDRTLKVWSIDGIPEDSEEPLNLRTRSVVAAHDKDINSVAVARNDSLVCTGSEDRTASIWRLPDLVHVVTLKGHKRRVFSVEFSPVDQCVMTASGDKTVKIWAISDGSCLKTFEGHTSSVLRASFITDGTQFVSCGADGLLKLWNVNTSECIATYDQHEDKVWALAVGRKTEMVATGGGDAVINLWHDSTASDKEDEFRKEEETILRGQELENAVLDAEYTKAIRLAFELRRPHKAYELFAGLCKKRESDQQIVKALKGLEKEEFRLLFEYVREWNTKPNRCHIAQFVLYQAFNILPPTEIVQVKGIGELLEGLIPYSQRHFKRMDRFVRSSFLLDYTLSEMSVIDPEPETEYPKDKKIEKEEVVIASVSAAMEQELINQETPSRKRKSQKSKDRSSKKRLIVQDVVAV